MRRLPVALVVLFLIVFLSSINPEANVYRLAAMNEIEREAVLTERFEKRKALQERREARRKAREAEGKKSSKDTSTALRVHSSANVSTGRDKLRTSVSGTRGKTATALDAYKKAKSAATRGDKIPQTVRRLSTMQNMLTQRSLARMSLTGVMMRKKRRRRNLSLRRSPRGSAWIVIIMLSAHDFEGRPRGRKCHQQSASQLMS